MKEYKFSEENARKSVKNQVVSRIPLILITSFAGLYIANIKNGGGILDSPLVLIVTLLMVAVAGTFGLMVGVKNGTKTLMLNVYRVTDNEIIRDTPSGKSVSIDFDKIDSHNLSKKGLMIKAPGKKILIPAELDSFSEISQLITEKAK